MPQTSTNSTNLQAIILAGRLDFGRQASSCSLPPALWPLAGQPVLERLLRHLDRSGIRHISLCGNSDAAVLNEAVQRMTELRATVQISTEQMPLGPAGVLVRTALQHPEALILLVSACTACPPDLNALIEAHQKARAAMTVVLNPKSNVPGPATEAADLYLLEPTVLEQVPRTGYCDIKETLIPALLRAGKTVKACCLTQPAGNFRNRAGYLQAVADFLETQPPPAGRWINPAAAIDPAARLHGPVLVMAGAAVAAGAVISGPCILEADTQVGPGSLLTGSVLWPAARIGADCQVRDCVMEHGAEVADGTIREAQMIKSKPDNWMGRITANVNKKVNRIFPRPPHRPAGEPGVCGAGAPAGKAIKPIWLGLALLAFAWSYWPTLTDLWKIWMQSDEYSCGLLVPFMALYVAWSRREQLARGPLRPSLWGLAAFLAAQGLRCFGLFFMYGSAERLSLVASIAALVWFLFGGSVFRKAIPIFVFLGLMLPLPKSLEAAITLPLQSMATDSAAFCLEMLGYDIRIEGNIIHLGQTTVAVAEACNGLRMVTSFFVISGLVILLVNRAWWEKTILLLSVLPIALLCNTIRLALTAIAFTILTGETWEQLFHDFGGYAMMPLALALVIFELWILRKIFVVPVEEPRQEILIPSGKQARP